MCTCPVGFLPDAFLKNSRLLGSDVRARKAQDLPFRRHALSKPSFSNTPNRSEFLAPFPRLKEAKGQDPPWFVRVGRLAGSLRPVSGMATFLVLMGSREF